MSDLPSDYRDRLDLRTVIAEIDRKRAETQKLQEETQKFVAEQHKLIAESRKYDRDRWLAPALAIAGIVGGLVTIATPIARALGWLP